jgi:acyl transferase domain-containing protein
MSDRKLSKLLGLWVRGVDIDWNKLYGEARPQRMSLPTYPFAKERYWIDTAAAGHAVPKAAATAVLHPLLHTNTSDLSQQSYSSTFRGDEFFLKDHEVDGPKTLPAAAYLEMARVAVEKAAARPSPETRLELRNVVWAQPIVVSANKQVSIALLANSNDEIDYEIYSREADQEIVHCQGRAVWSRQAAPARPRTTQGTDGKPPIRGRPAAAGSGGRHDGRVCSSSELDGPRAAGVCRVYGEAAIAVWAGRVAHRLDVPTRDGCMGTLRGG